jgi:ACS family hexuronate transporter-like MFS transporter
MINYIDRQTLSVLKPLVKSTLNTDEAGYAQLVNIFTFCYAGSYILTGWITDRLGARIGFILFIGLWSVATIGCGMSNTFLGFALCRALLGLAEPGNQPVTIRALTLWVPTHQRGLTMSLVGAGGTVGSIVAAPAVAWLANSLGWHAAFVFPGLMGLAVGLAWWFVYRNPPHINSVPTEAATENWVPPLSWGKLWRHRSLWGIVIARFISDPVWYFCLFWMPGYFQEQRGLSLKESGVIGWIPFLAASIGGISLAATSDLVGRKLGSPLRGRVRVLWIIALLGPSAMLVPRVDSLTVTVALLCIVAVVSLGWLSILGPLVADVFPAGNVGSVWAIAGASGATGAIIFNYQVGHITSALGSANMFLILGVLHLLASAVIMILVREVKPKAVSTS